MSEDFRKQGSVILLSLNQFPAVQELKSMIMLETFISAAVSNIILKHGADYNKILCNTFITKLNMTQLFYSEGCEQKISFKCIL